MPIYSSETKWYVDDQGLISVEVGGVLYGEGSKSDNPPTEDGEEIVASDNPMLQSWEKNATTDFHADEYKSKITKVKFATNVRIPNSKVESWDVLESKDKSVMAWVESDEADGYILTIAGKEKIVANTNSSYLFYEFNKVNEIENVNLLDTSNVTNMSFMFYGCNMLTSLDLEGISTSNVTDMSHMFVRWYNCKSLDLSNFDTSNVINMSSMFENSNFNSLNLEGWNTSKVSHMGTMFNSCRNLISIGEKGLDISNNLDMQSMFAYTTKLKTILNIKGSIRNTYNTFYKAISDPSAQITLNYAEGYEEVVDDIINSFQNANLVKGTQIIL